jgi:hypothetical protein
MFQPFHSLDHAVSRWFYASGFNVAALITSFQEQIEWGLRIVGMLAALAYTTILIVKACKTK